MSANTSQHNHSHAAPTNQDFIKQSHLRDIKALSGRIKLVQPSNGKHK